MALESKQSVTLRDCHKQSSKPGFKICQLEKHLRRQGKLYFFLAHLVPSPLYDTQGLTFQLPHRSSQNPQTKRNRMYRIEPKRQINHYNSIITFILFFFFFLPHVTDRDFQNTKGQFPNLEWKINQQVKILGRQQQPAASFYAPRHNVLHTRAPTGTGIGHQNYLQYILRNVK